MRSTFLFIVVLVLLFGKTSPRVRGQEKVDGAELAQKELAALQGTWKCLRWEQDGKLMSKEQTAKVSFTVKGDRYKSTVDGVSFLEGTFVVDPTKTPHHWHASSSKGPWGAIYVRAGEFLIMCNGGPRPTEFVSGSPKGGPSLYVYKIEK